MAPPRRLIARLFAGAAGSVAAVLVLVATTLGSRAAEFSADAWRRAVDPASRSWSRESIVRDFATVVPESRLIGMTRAEILALLGEPGLSERYYYYSGAGPQGRVDFYRLSAANNPSFRLDYAEDDKVKSVLLEASPCVCALCNSESRVSRAVLERTLLASSSTTQPASSMAEIEKLIGAAGKSDVTKNTVGGQLWANYSEVWRLSDDPNGYFIASGHIAARNWTSLAEAPAYDLVLVSAWPNCLAP